MVINFELEKEVVSALLQEPELVDQHYINPQWFVDKRLHQIASVLKESPLEERSTFDVFARIKANYPQTNVNFEFLTMILKSAPTTANVLYHLKTLERQFLNGQLVELMSDYTRTQSAETLAIINDTIAVMKRSGIKADDGTLESSLAEMDERLETDGDYGIVTYAGIDQMLGGGIYGGMLITIGARPGVGKTAFACVNLVEKAFARNKDLACDIFTLEMSKREMVNRFVSYETGISSNRLRKPNLLLTESQKRQVRVSLANLKSLNIRVFDRVPEINGILAAIKQRAAENSDRPYFAVIDYLGLIKTNDKKRDRRLELEEITRELKVLANEWNIAIILLSQLNRGVEGRQNKVPQLSDLRETGSIEQDSNVVCFLSRAEDDKKHDIDLTVQKNREGTLGTIKFKYDGNKMLFEEVFE